MVIGFGLAFAIIAEYLRRRKLKFLEPGDWIVELVREMLVGVDETRLSDAERRIRLVKRFIKSDRDLYGDESVHRVRNILHMSEMLRGSGKVGESREWLALGIRLLEHNLLDTNAGDCRLAEAYLKMASIDTATNNTVEAEQWFLKAIASIEKSADASKLATTLRQFGDFKAAIGRIDDAQAVYARELAVCEDILPPTSCELEDVLSYHLAFLRRSNKEDAANKLDEYYRLVLAVSMLENGAGEDSVYLARDLEALASYLTKRGRPSSKNVEPLFERARILRLMYRVKGDEYPGIIRDLEDVAEWLEQRNSGGDATVAFRMRRRAKLIKERNQGSSNSSGHGKAKTSPMFI